MRRVAALVTILCCCLGTLAARAGQDGTTGPAVTLCIVVDLTASMVQVPGLGFDREAADDQVSSAMVVVADLLEPRDRIRFGRVAATIAFGPSFVTPDETARATAVLTAPESERYGPSPVWDAIDEALGLLEPEPGTRAVIVWTDGRASGNRLSRHDVARRAAAMGVPIHVVSPPTETVIRLTESTGVRIRPAVYLEWLAETTGGGFHLTPREATRPFGNPVAPMRDVLAALKAAGRR